VLRAAVIGYALACLSWSGLHAEEIPSERASTAFALTHVIPPEMRFEVLPLLAPDTKDNPATADKIALGRLLFFNPELSSTKDVSCATCHHPRLGWTDGRATPIGVGGTGIGPTRTFRTPDSLPLLARNVPTILNVGFNGLLAGTKPDPAAAPMFWDSRVQSLERQALAPIRSREEMRGDACADTEAVKQAVERIRAIGEYCELFSAVFGQPSVEAVTPEHLAQAIAAFERSLVTPHTAFDRFLNGDASALNSEQRHDRASTSRPAAESTQPQSRGFPRARSLPRRA
jgi:cytochrome c peroxidase